jgi:glutathione S-transferase
MKPEYVKNAAVKLKEISTFLGSHPYFAGQNVNEFFSFSVLILCQ